MQRSFFTRRDAMRSLVVMLFAGAAGAVRAQSWAWDDGTVPFVVSPDDVVHRMLRIAEVGPGDRLIDLGSGDGRIVIGAAKRGASARGVDIDPSLVERARERAARAGVTERAGFEVRDLFETDLSWATVVTMYLLPELNLKLMPALLKLAPGTRVVSHDWDMGAWKPDETLEMRAPDKMIGGRGGLSHIHLWVIPARAGGQWHGRVDGLGGPWRFDITQVYQEVEAEARAEGRDILVRAARLRGAEIKLAVNGVIAGRARNLLFTGTIDGDRMHGTVRVYDGEEETERPWNATRIR